MSDAFTCEACPNHCVLGIGDLGRCRARMGTAEGVACANYGRATSLALDPVEKKPLSLWRPGSLVLSVGSYGCNLSCPFCQNSSISCAGPDDVGWREVSPAELVGMAAELRKRDPRVTGVAFTYNEPLVGWEYVRDCARLAHEAGLANVLVSNGMACAGVIERLAGLIDAANIDLKAWAQEGYDQLGAPEGGFDCVRRTIEALVGQGTCHLEVTTLAVPGLADDEASIDAMASWLASLDSAIGYHITRFFPRHRMTDVQVTPVERVHVLASVARRHLKHVFVGNC